MGIITKLLKIERSEFAKVLDFTLLGALLQAGISIGLTAGDTLFLTKAGADKLPLIYILTPLVFLIYIPLYSYLTSRFGINYVFKLTLAILALGGAAIYVLLNSFDGKTAEFAIYAAKLYSILWYIALYTLFWNFVDGFFDILDAKRLFSALSAGSALGAAIGGGLIAAFGGMFDVDEYFLFWSLISVATYPVLCRCLKRWKLIESEITTLDGNHGIIEESKALVKTFRSSRFSVLLGSLLFTTMVVTLICEYQYSNIFTTGRNEQELAALFGMLFLIVNIFNLLMNLFVFNRLALNLGVRNVAMIQPVVYMLAFAFFIFEHSFLAGVFGFFAFHGILTSIDFNNTNLLINALPKESKRQLRTFIEGICEPMANAAAGIFLIFVVAKMSPVQISSIGLCGAALCLVLALLLRGEYLQSLILNLKKSWLDFTSSAGETALQIDDSEEIEKLLKEADSLNTAERRDLEQLLFKKGLISVPLTVKVLKDKRCSYRSRSVAARALSRLSPAQLESLSAGLIFEETKRASLYSKRKEILLGAGRTSLGLEVLGKFCGDQEKIVIDFVLELLALNGRVANFELLQANLRSSNKKERGDAIETIQQACDSRTNRLILPLLSADKKGKHKSAEDSGLNNLYAALKLSLDSPIELEAAAAAEALSVLGFEMDRREETESLLRKRLATLADIEPVPDLLVDTIFSVLTTPVAPGGEHTIIRKIALLQQSDFFKGFSCEELRQIALETDSVNISSGTSINCKDEDRAYLIISGEIKCKKGRKLGTFDLLGEDLYYGKKFERVSAISDISALRIPRQIIAKLLDNNAALSIWILSRISAKDFNSSALNGEISPLGAWPV